MRRSGSENASLRSGLSTADSRVAELEALVAEFQKDQARIEEGIVEALRKLDSFEDSVHEAVAQAKPPGRRSPTTRHRMPSSPQRNRRQAPVADSADALDMF